MTARPLVSICVPTRNRAALLEESLPTILGQDYAPLEILISDNASTDDTPNIGRALAAHDPRVRYVRHDADIGLYGNHNFCLANSRGDFIGLWHDDDTRATSLATRFADFLIQHPGVGVVGADYSLIDDDGKSLGWRDRRVPDVTTGMQYIARTFASGQSSIGCPGAMIRRSALGDFRFREQGPIGFADFVLWCEIAERADVGHIRERLWTYRLHRRSLSRRKLWDSVQDYEFHLGGYCDTHLARHPEHEAHVRTWRRSLDRFLFRALAYELGAHAGSPSGRSQASYRTVFDVADYQLDASETAAILQLMRAYQRGPVQAAALLSLSSMLRLRMTRPLRWAAGYMAARRNSGQA